MNAPEEVKVAKKIKIAKKAEPESTEKINTQAEIVVPAQKTNSRKTKKKGDETVIDVNSTVNSKVEQTVLDIAETSLNTAELQKAITEKPLKKILFVSSEAAPFITTGGLGEVIGALPKALHEATDDVDVRIVIPFYEKIMNQFMPNVEFFGKTYVDLGWRHQYCGIYTTKVGKVTYYFVDNEYYFKRADCYGFFDDGERFAFFGKAVLDILEMIDFIPDIIHTHDWQSALVSVYLRTTYASKEAFKNIKTIFTIHNIEYQGKYNMSILYDIFDIPFEFKKLVEFDGAINLMKGAMMCSDIISTVSPSYANEIHHYHYAYGLDPIVNMQTEKIRGILNGIDTASYNPADDSKIYMNYDADSLEKKAENKLKLQEYLYLPKDASIPMICIITRLVKHKGIDLIVGAMNELKDLPMQFVVLGQGDREFEFLFESFKERHSEKIGVIIGYDNDLSRKIYAAADMAIMPSKFEPCGITQMIASRYGTVPLVRETGGLKDSIKPYNPEDGSGNGFTFCDYMSESVVDVVSRAIAVYNNKDEWNNLAKRVANWDFSWTQSAKEYLKMYDEVL